VCVLLINPGIGSAEDRAERTKEKRWTLQRGKLKFRGGEDQCSHNHSSNDPQTENTPTLA
jgi:hypothetical protein